MSRARSPRLTRRQTSSSAVAHLDQPQEQRPGRLPPGLVQAGEHLVRAGRDGVPDPAGELVAMQGQPVAFVLRPGGPQRVGQQRQPPGLVPGLIGRAVAGHPGVPEQHLDQARLDVQAHVLGWEQNGLAQLGGGHRVQQDRAGLERGPQRPMPDARVVEVGAHADQHQRGGLRTVRGPGGQPVQQVDEDLPLPLVGAQGEGFLELVDQDHRPRRCARPGRPSWDARQRPAHAGHALLRGGQPGPGQRLGFPASERAQLTGQRQHRVRGGCQQRTRPGPRPGRREPALVQGRDQAGPQQ